MTDTTKTLTPEQYYAELIRLGVLYAREVAHFTIGEAPSFTNEYTAFKDYARTLTDRIAELEADNSAYIKALAECRDVFPAPPVNTEIDQLFVEAIGMPECVPAYVRAQIEAVGAGGVGQRWPMLEKPAALQAGGMFGKGVSSRLLVEAAYRHYERTEAERTKTPEQRKDDEVRRRALWDIIHGAPTPRPHQSTEPASQAAKDVLAERQRQISVEGWTPEHDDEHDGHEMAHAAACYILGHSYPSAFGKPAGWPWPAEWWKPTTYRRNLTKAGALILAEIERIDRATTKKEPS